MTETLTAQHELEQDCAPLLANDKPPSLASLRIKHASFLRSTLALKTPLPAPYSALDASRAWILFWAVNALSLLGVPLSEAELRQVGETALSYQHPNGGFGGGPGQPAHMASTYAAVMTLAHTGPEFWCRIDRPALFKWILSLKTVEGSIKVCEHGEADPRATYCALAVTTLLGLECAELKAGIGSYLKKCQTYEGGFANEPFGEAHGGYAFCSLASLVLLNATTDPTKGIEEHCSTTNLRRWLVARQDLLVQGFSGRTNKLVDGCYSHWVGGCWPLLSQVKLADGSSAPDLFSRRGLYDYTIKCCQNAQSGGLRDKPGVRPDAYHTNYNLCGLACSLYKYELLNNNVFDWKAELTLKSADPANIVQPINPVFGIPLPETARIKAWLMENPVPSILSPTPSSREYQGFALYVGATVALFSYLAWALLSASWLHFIKVDYYPSRWWAIAIPAFILMLMLYVYVALGLYNTERLTKRPDAAETICDKNTEVHDVSLVEVNTKLYGSKG